MRVKLRSFRKEDIETYRGWVNDPKIGALVGRVSPVTVEEHTAWYTNLMANLNAIVYAITVDSKYIGNVELWNIDRSNRKAEIRILMGKSQGLGYGTEAISQVTKYGFATLKLKRVYAYVFTYNKRAQSAFMKAGFKVEGILKSERFINGKYVDTLIMARLKDGI